jgi:sialate O-acetylesterase
MKRNTFFFALTCVAIACGFSQADVKLPAVIDSHMVIQRDVPVVIWGWADPTEPVLVKMGDASVDAVADRNGNWRVSLPAQKADGKVRQITITGKNSIILEDVLVGEVWLGSGQSNMEWAVAQSKGAKEAIAAADHPQVRLFHVPKVQAKEPAKDVKAKWLICSTKTIPNFSAVLYYFGLKLQKELNVPIGLINSSWGGSPIEPWTIKGNTSGGMYNGMIAPVAPFAVRGMVWYQGETNVLQKNGLAYTGKMTDLIEGWRKVWGNEFPFYFVQIAPWQGSYAPGELPALWEAQVASLKLPHTGMAVTTDLVDNIKDIHPQNKLDVGNRLALWALAKTYGKKDLVYSGPLFKSMKVDGNKIRIEFAHVGGGLQSRDGKPLSEFEIATEDGKFVPAEAVIYGDAVVVSSKDVIKPSIVRFGWSNTANPNLMNKAGLPASPFQTKNWTGGTGE